MEGVHLPRSPITVSAHSKARWALELRETVVVVVEGGREKLDMNSDPGSPSLRRPPATSGFMLSRRGGG